MRSTVKSILTKYSTFYAIFVPESKKLAGYVEAIIENIPGGAEETDVLYRKRVKLIANRVFRQANMAGTLMLAPVVGRITTVNMKTKGIPYSVFDRDKMSLGIGELDTSTGVIKCEIKDVQTRAWSTVSSRGIRAFKGSTTPAVPVWEVKDEDSIY